jgi:hypothetical protein
VNPYAVLTRVFLTVLVHSRGLGIDCLPHFLVQSSVERTARLIIYGHPFKIEALGKLIPTVEAIEQAKYCRPAALRSAAIIRLRMAGTSFPRENKTVSPCAMQSPADPFLWLVLFG